MNVLMLLSNAFTHDPRVYAEAQSLVKAGYGVTVVALDREREHPAKSVLDGISVERVRVLPPLRGPRPLRPLIMLFNGMNLLLLAQWQMYRRALRLHRENRFSVIHCHDLDTLIAGVALKRRTKLPLIYDAHEIYGYMMARQSPHWVASRFLWLEKQLVRRVDSIINVCEPQRRYSESITDRPITLVMNCKPLQGLEYRRPGNDVFTLLYIGVLHKGRSIPLLIDAVEELDGVACTVGGVGPPEEVQAIAAKCSAAKNVHFLGKVDMHDVIPMTMQADCVFLMVNPEDLNNRIGLGNKQFEAMVCGRPIICTKGTHSGDVTEQENVGLAVEYDKESLKSAIVMLRDDPSLSEGLGRNALNAAIGKYNWEKQEEALLGIYRSVASV